MRRLLAVFSSAALALGMLVGVTTPASAASVGSVTFTGGSPPTLDKSLIAGAVGDTFTITVSGNGAVMNVVGAAVSDSGGNVCDPGCFGILEGETATFTIESAGSVVLEDSNTMGSATLTIVISGPVVIRPLDEVYPTLFFNANGGSCVGAMKHINVRGAIPTAVAPEAIQCSRQGYTMGGWARSADATTSEFAPGSVVPIGAESFTLFAVWVPTGSLITYDANIGANDACINAEGVDVPVGEGRESTDLNPANLASTAPCAPDNDQLELAGWATSGDGPVAYELGAQVPFPVGTRQRLYAVWQVVQPERSIEITGEAVDVVNNSGLVRLEVTGVATGFAEGDVVVPWRGEPGEEPFAESIRLPQVQADGTFTWQRRTGKGITEIVYFTSQDGSVRSNSITFQDEPTLEIEGERGFVRGASGVVFTGTATGFSAGDRVIPWIKFPGQTSYVKVLARPEVQADGSFRWERRTSKKVYVYFTSEDESVRSNRVILPTG